MQHKCPHVDEPGTGISSTTFSFNNDLPCPVKVTTTAATTPSVREKKIKINLRSCYEPPEAACILHGIFLLIPFLLDPVHIGYTTLTLNLVEPN